MDKDEKNIKNENEDKKDKHKTVTTPAYSTPKKSKSAEVKKETDKKVYSDSADALEALLDGEEVKTIPFEEKKSEKVSTLIEKTKTSEKNAILKKSNTTKKTTPVVVNSVSKSTSANDKKKWWIIGGISFAVLILLCCCIGYFAISFLSYTEY